MCPYRTPSGPSALFSQDLNAHLISPILTSSSLIVLTKEFDNVSIEGLWKIMVKYGYHRKCISVVPQLHEGMQAGVAENDELSRLSVSNGLK